MNTTKLIIKEYHDQLITFDLSDEVMINLTEMSKPYGKRPNDFLELEQTKDFLDELANPLSYFNTSQNGNELKQYVIKKHGGNDAGTWIHRKLAIKAAAWLDPKFEVWMINQIDELMIKGVVNRPSYILNDPIERAKMWIAEEQERQHLITVNNALMHVLKTYTITELAKELGFRSASALNKALHNRGIQYKNNGTWILYAKYAEIGLVEVKQGINHAGYAYYNQQWTQKGREFVIALLASREVA